MSIACYQCGAAVEGDACPKCGAVIHAAAAVEVVAVEAEPVEVEAIAVEAIPVASGPASGSSRPAFKNAPKQPPPPEEEKPLISGGKNRDSEELDMTPMVDVTFLLLIFFMVTASFSLQKSITMPREQSDAPSVNTQDEEPEELDLVTVQIDEFNAFNVIAADWEREVPGKQNLIRALREAKPESEARLKIEVHEDAVIEAVVDAMDAGTEIGFSEIQKTEVKDF